MNGRDTGLAVLEELPRSELVGFWKTHYGSEPPTGISRRLLIGAVAYAQQVKDRGGLSPRLSRRLKKLAGGTPVSEVAVPRTLTPGARLVREWNSTTHVVEVVSGGYVWNGDRYKSLSAVARAITGARWSGPRFFGTGS